MKGKFTILAVFLASFLTSFAQQPPNGSFENFSDPFTPVGWIGVEDLSQNILGLQSSIFTFQDTTTFTKGSASIKLVTDTIPHYVQLVGVIPGIISLGTGMLDINNNPVFFGIPFNYRPDSIIFDYKLTSPGLDTAGAQLTLTRHDSAVFYHGLLLAPDSNWVHMAVSLTGGYSNSNFPDNIQIQFVASYGNNPVIGTTLHVDDLHFGYINRPISATITASGPLSFCAPDSVILHANTGTGYTYQWSKNDIIIGGATSSSYVAKTTGSYTVEVDSAGSAAGSFPVVVQVCNNLNELTDYSFSVYPNPTNGLLNINSNVNLAGFNMQMFDVVGRLVTSQTLVSLNNSFNVSNLANGTYVYRITDKDNNVVAQSKFNVVK